MSYEFYKVVHLAGVLVLFLSLGTLTATAGAAGPGLRRLAAAAHGVALAIILVAGFGLLARLGIMGDIPLWAWLKLGAWLGLGAIVAPLRRRPQWAPALWVAAPILGAISAWLAIAKPG